MNATGRWYRAAAEQGLPAAQHKLGLAYLAGRGLREADSARGGRWLERAASLGEARGHDSLAFAHAVGPVAEPDGDTEPAVPPFLYLGKVISRT